MNFDLRARSNDMQHPAYHFPGDETIPGSEYTQVIFGGYMSSISTLCGAARGHGLTVDAETFERWKRVGAAAGFIDDFLDTPDDIRAANKLYQTSVASAYQDITRVSMPENADPQLNTAIQLMGNSVRTLPEERQRQLLVVSQSIGNIAVQKAECEDMSAYVAILKEEARLSARIVEESASDTVRAQPNFDIFATACADALEFGTFADSARDLWADKRNGRVSVEASASNSVTLARVALKAARRMWYPASVRKAMLQGISARVTFSKLPTNLTMRLYRP